MSWPRHLLLVMLAALWCGAIVSCPWLVRAGLSSFQLLLTLFFAQICHQDPARSFLIGGAQLPVCSRCTSIYFGGLAGIALYPWLASLREFEDILKWAAFAASGFMLLDASLDFIGVWQNTFSSRSLTGFLFGGICGTCLGLVIQRLPRRLHLKSAIR